MEYMPVLLSDFSLAASLADHCSYTELCGFAAAERAEHYQQQAHRDFAKRLGQPGAGQDAVPISLHVHWLLTSLSLILGISVSASLGSCGGRVPSLPYSMSGH